MLRLTLGAPLFVDFIFIFCRFISSFFWNTSCSNFLRNVWKVAFLSLWLSIFFFNLLIRLINNFTEYRNFGINFSWAFEDNSTVIRFSFVFHLAFWLVFLISGSFMLVISGYLWFPRLCPDWSLHGRNSIQDSVKGKSFRVCVQVAGHRLQN